MSKKQNKVSEGKKRDYTSETMSVIFMQAVVENWSLDTAVGRNVRGRGQTWHSVNTKICDRVHKTVCCKLFRSNNKGNIHSRSRIQLISNNFIIKLQIKVKTCGKKETSVKIPSSCKNTRANI